MLDIKFLRENPDIVKENIKKKFQDHKLPLVDEVIELDKERREVQAEADAIKMMNEASPAQNTIAIKGLAAFEQAANGPANKLIIPSDLAGITGLATAVTEAIKTGKE